MPDQMIIYLAIHSLQNEFDCRRADSPCAAIVLRHVPALRHLGALYHNNRSARCLLEEAHQRKNNVADSSTVPLAESGQSADKVKGRQGMLFQRRLPAAQTRDPANPHLTQGGLNPTDGKTALDDSSTVP